MEGVLGQESRKLVSGLSCNKPVSPARLLHPSKPRLPLLQAGLNMSTLTPAREP